MKPTFITILLLSFLPIASAAGDTPVTIKYLPSKTDTAALIASDYYGSRKRSPFVINIAEVTKDRPLAKRKYIRMPVVFVIHAEKGDSFQSLAKEYLAKSYRDKYLAEFNNRFPKESLAVGEPVRIPFHTKHTATKKTSLRSIAYRYYGSKEKSSVLKAYNNIKKNLVAKGSSVDVPFVWKNSTISKARVTKKAKARFERFQKQSRAANLLLPTMKAAWHIGDYASIQRQLEQIDTPYLPMPLAAEVLLLLGQSYVALGQPDKAAAVFTLLRERDLQWELDPKKYSPTVLQAFDAAMPAKKNEE